jgi:predicted HTH transcriptional regulator
MAQKCVPANFANREETMNKLRIFVSSVQRELENERIAVSEIITTDSFLHNYCVPVLYEYEPASPDKALLECLKCVDSCDIFLILIWNEYGHVENGISISHGEYKRAKENYLPILVYIKNSSDMRRSEEVKEKLLKEILELTKQLIAAAEKNSSEQLNETHLRQSLLARGLLWNDPDSGQDYATAAAVLLLADDPSITFPHCRILADAFRGSEKTSQPSDQEDIREPMPKAIERAIEFVQRNTRHPMRVVGLNRVQLNEYPIEALREALVNAMAHREYELEGLKIFLTVFFDRVVVASPGLPPKPITFAKIRSGNYRPCSRNPLIAHNLSFFQRIEERGSGIGRMKDAMADHGLDTPCFLSNSGFFEVILPGPGDNLVRLRVKADSVGQTVTPSIESKLNERQKKIMSMLVQGENLTSRRCEQTFGTTRDTANRDFKYLISLSLIEPKGKGRGRYYTLKRQE